ncbi:hypothetical protein [Bartonella sp. HY406]|uniref:hypothetical protein n=1 Tax=Bartonella sp. HY406 TaxID=2979331 RepID=UPI0021C66630|nr:hypothetical protein [Bartonella sp. HY406]UXN03123.1 hypothetical protein N6B01_11755 [Bartonella sp. HY406]
MKYFLCILFFLTSITNIAAQSNNGVSKADILNKCFKNSSLKLRPDVERTICFNKDHIDYIVLEFTYLLNGKPITEGFRDGWDYWDVKDGKIFFRKDSQSLLVSCSIEWNNNYLKINQCKDDFSRLSDNFWQLK